MQLKSSQISRNVSSSDHPIEIDLENDDEDNKMEIEEPEEHRAIEEDDDL